MRFAAVAALASVASIAYAATVNVLVGDQGLLAFNPENVVANVGDQIVFTFVAKNHSVVQSSFAAPCSPLAGGFNAGFHNISGTDATLPQVSFTLMNASVPLWFYCAQTNPKSHCQSGMVFAINANDAKPFDTFKATAMGTNSSTSGSTSTTPGSGALSSVSLNRAAIVSAIGLLAGLLL